MRTIGSTVNYILLFATLYLIPPSTVASNKIDIEITTHLGDAQTFVEGDVISFFISLNQDAYVYILMQDATGKITQLVPNNYSQNNFFEAGLFIPIPNQSNPYKFTISPPFGKETLWAIATSGPLAELPNINDKILSTLQQDYRKLARTKNHNFGSDDLSIITKKHSE